MRELQVVFFADMLTIQIFLIRFNMAFIKYELIQLTNQKILNEMIRFNS